MAHEAALKFFSDFIESQLGIVYDERNYYQLVSRLEEVAKKLKIDDIPGLHRKAIAGIDSKFRDLLLDTATNNETSFFRDPRVFQTIQSQVLEQYVAPLKTPIDYRIWSAASSTGQEPITLAIVMSEIAEKLGPNFRFQITATDICDRALSRARAAEYSEFEVQRGLSQALLAKYFENLPNGRWVAQQKLRRHIDYQKLNLRSPFHSLGKFHLVLCRNVLIYQAIPGKIDVLTRIAHQLEPHGLLFLGAGESVLGLADALESVSNDDRAVFFRLKRESLTQAA